MGHQNLLANTYLSLHRNKPRSMWKRWEATICTVHDVDFCFEESDTLFFLN